MGSGGLVAVGGDVYATLATGTDTNGGYFLTHAVVPAGGGLPAHIHTREEEAFYVIRGELTFLMGEEEAVAPAGTFVHVPRGLKHRFGNASGEEAEMIFWFTPPGIEGMFAEMAAEPARFLEIGREYGVEYCF